MSRAHQAFSLTELLIVLAVLGILVALSASWVLGFLDRGRLSEAVNAITSQIEDARRSAKLRDEDVTFILSVGVDAEPVLLVDGVQRAFPGGVTVVGAPHQLTFEAPYGTRSDVDLASGDAQIPISVRGRASATIVVTGVFGRTATVR